MNKIISLVAALLLAVAAGAYSQERIDVVESFTPSSAVFFLKTARVKNAIVSLKYIVDNLLSREYADKFNRKKEEIKAKTGIDPMDIESLRNAGIDVNRTMSLAIYAKGRQNEERVLLFIPVLDDKTFPLKFVEVLKKLSKRESSDLYPAITDYNGYSLYQISRDVFTTAVDGVFIIGSTGELVRSVIDVKKNNTGYLALDPLYSDCLARTKKNYDLRVFMTRDFLKDVMKPVRKDDGDLRKEDKKESNEKASNDGMLMNVHYLVETAGNQPSVRSELDKFSTGPSPFNSVDYAFVGGSVTPAEVAIDLAARFNNTSGTVNSFLSVIKTGTSGRALYVKNAAAYAYVSLDYGRIAELCSGSAAGCAYYGQFRDQVARELGLDFEKDIVPYYSGVVNVIAGQPKGGGGGYVLYFPIDDAARGKKAWEKSSAYCAGKFKGTERYGTATIGGERAFWYIDEKNSKNYVVCDKRGFYLGNDQELAAAALAGREIGQKSLKDDVMGRLGDNVFFLAHVKKESYFGSLLMLYSYRANEISGLVEKMTDLYVIGDKKDNFVSLGIVVKLMKRK